MLRNAKNKFYLDHMECFGRKYFDYATPTHQKQAAYPCELGIFAKVTGKRLGRTEKGQRHLV